MGIKKINTFFATIKYSMVNVGADVTQTCWILMNRNRSNTTHLFRHNDSDTNHVI